MDSKEHLKDLIEEFRSLPKEMQNEILKELENFTDKQKRREGVEIV